MSAEDRKKWNARYRAGAYEEREHPSAWLASLIPNPITATPGARALDVACGLGRNARFLAREGYQVDAVDISAEGLARADKRSPPDLPIRWQCVDLDDGLPATLTGYDLIVVVRFLDEKLFRELPSRLRPGGWLCVETHLATEAEVAGPRHSRFRSQPGALASCFAGLEVHVQDEGLFTDPDGERVALARFAGRRRSD